MRSMQYSWRRTCVGCTYLNSAPLAPSLATHSKIQIWSINLPTYNQHRRAQILTKRIHNSSGRLYPSCPKSQSVCATYVSSKDETATDRLQQPECARTSNPSSTTPQTRRSATSSRLSNSRSVSRTMILSVTSVSLEPSVSLSFPAPA